jgi:hypothetical protein
MINIGDKVVCIKLHHSIRGLVLGKEYIVHEINCCCNDVSYNVGIPFQSNPIYEGIECGICYTLISTEWNFYDSYCFKKVEEQIEIEEPILN